MNWFRCFLCTIGGVGNTSSHKNSSTISCGIFFKASNMLYTSFHASTFLILLSTGFTFLSKTILTWLAVHPFIIAVVAMKFTHAVTIVMSAA